MNMYEQEKDNKTNLTVRSQRKYQFGITSIFIVTMAVAIFGSTSMSVNESRLKMEDELRIKQIVTNLLTNAVKYTLKGGIRMRVNYRRIGADQIDLVISVEDTGMGIRQEDMEKLFERFQKLDEKNTRNIEGTGLGLNIAMSLLKLMGGSMKVDSEYRKGSTFTVTIPQKVLNNEPTGDFTTVMGRQASDTEQERSSFEAPEANILVVDDNDINLDVFQALLKRTKMNIVTADSGKACLELVKKEHFHIIFMDHMMPEMDGVETLHEIQKLTQFPNENTPVIALTANAISGARELYLKEGFADFLTKPVDPDLLEELIASYLPEELVKMNKAAQETVSEDSFKKEEFSRLEQKGFHISTGMRYCHGDSEFYEEMLVRFTKDAEQKAADIETSFQNEDIINYQVLVHSLKSSSKMIGADGLSEMARGAEEAAKTRNLSYIRGNHRTLMDKYRETARYISDVFRLADALEADLATKTEVSGQELSSRLSELQKSLETFEADRAETILAEMRGFVYQGVSVRELLRDVSRDVEDFELGAAAGKVKELIASFLAE